MKTFNYVASFLVENFGVTLEEVDMNARVLEDLGADSLDVIELTIAMEEDLGIDIPDEQVDDIVTVGDIVVSLDKILEERGLSL